MAATTTTATDDLTAEVTAWLDANWDPDLTVEEWWGRLGPSGWAVPTWPVESYGKGLSRSEGVRVMQTISGYPRAGRARWPRHAARGPHDLHPRHRRAEGALPPRHRHRQAGLVPALQRARRGLRPRRSQHARRARRRRVGRQRSEGLDLGRALVRPRHAVGAHRSRRRQAPGHHLLRGRHAPAGHRDPPAEGAHRSRDVQRGVPHRRARARRRRHRWRQQRVGGRQHHADVRAQRPRRGWRWRQCRRAARHHRR